MFGSVLGFLGKLMFLAITSASANGVRALAAHQLAYASSDGRLRLPSSRLFTQETAEMRAFYSGTDTIIEGP